jgi:hypothetical protein
MRKWNLTADDPITLTLSADSRVSNVNYLNDHTWQLSIGTGEPPALIIETTFGLRARNFRIFPQFTEDDIKRIDPKDFTRPVTLHKFYPNYYQISYYPFPNISVKGEYWIPESNAIACRLTIKNFDKIPRALNIDWTALLSPIEDGHRMAPTELSAVTVLNGKTSDLSPLVFLTGGAKSGNGPYPSLVLPVEISPGEDYDLICCQAALSTAEASFELARDIAALNWEAEIAKIEVLNNGCIDIQTGDQDWDTTFAFSQKEAFRLIINGTDQLPNSSFVRTRQPDQGYSLRGDGSDYSHLWNGQTPLETYHLMKIILPLAPELAKGLLLNFLETQSEDGFIDWKPGPSGQRSGLLATPILVKMAWLIYQATEDFDFIKSILPDLLTFVKHWLDPQRDRDGDGIPEWDHLMQTNFDDHPLFSQWQSWSLGVDITTIECPDLTSYLYSECQSLIRIAEIMEEHDIIQEIQTISNTLKSGVIASWITEDNSYHYRDRDTHLSPPLEILGSRTGPGEIFIDQEFETPIRIVFYIQNEEETTRNVNIFIHGTSTSGEHRVERVSKTKIHWYLGNGYCTSSQIYSSLEHIMIQGIGNDDKLNVQSICYLCSDQSLLVPIWAGVPEQNIADALIEHTITNKIKFWQSFGIPACIESVDENAEPHVHRTHLIWNSLIGEGLISYGHLDQAAELLIKIMKSVIRSLKHDHAFRMFYNSKSGIGEGEFNPLAGLAPISLFLDTLGVKIISPNRVALSGFNPFPWPVTVKYRGLTIIRKRKRTTVIFSDGQNINVRSPKPQIISLR